MPKSVFSPTKLLTLLSSIGFCHASLAQPVSPIEWIFLPPRLTLEVASASNTFAAADAMVPLFGSPTQSFYIDGSGKYGDDHARLGSIGLGARGIWSNTIIGGYFFGDFNRSPESNHFDVLNPGLEFMTPLWDGRINGYFPIRHKTVYMDTFTGLQLGKPDSIFYTGHTQRERLFNSIEEVAPGADVQLGYTAPNLHWTRFFAGGYGFSPKYTRTVRGIAGGFETPLKFNWAEVKIQDSYDNIEKNTFLVSLQLTFGGLNKIGSYDVVNRMLDLIPRHIADLQTGDGIPTQKKIINKGQTLVLDSNLWFFNPDGSNFGDTNPVTTFESCTFEHPCIGLSQDRIDSINRVTANAKLYLSSGTYNSPDLGSAFCLRNGQSIYGRIPGFSQPAFGSARPILNDSLFLEGNNNVYNVAVIGQSMRPLSTGGEMFPFQVGVLLRSFAGGNANIYNSDISVTSSVNNIVAAANNSNIYNLFISGSRLTSTSNNLIPQDAGASGVTIGAANLQNGSLTLDRSFITTNSFSDTQQFNVTFGFVNNESGLVNINQSVFTVNANNGGIVAGILSNSSLGLGLGTMNIDDSIINVTADNNQIVGGVFIQANNLIGKSADVNINNTDINVIGNNNPFGTTAGVFLGGDGTASINATNINASANDGFVAGILNPDPNASANILNSIIAVNTAGVATGVPIVPAGTINDLGGNQCFLDGVPVPCLP